MEWRGLQNNYIPLSSCLLIVHLVDEIFERASLPARLDDAHLLLALLGEEFDFVDGLNVRMLQLRQLLVQIPLHLKVTCEVGRNIPLNNAHHTF